MASARPSARPPSRKKGIWLAAIGAILGVIAAWIGFSAHHHADADQPTTTLPIAANAGNKPQLAVFTSLPLFWADADDLGTLLTSNAPPHWFRAALDTRFAVQPVDALMSDNGAPAPLEGKPLAIIAQPRPLAPRELVNLDEWLRAGGKALIFADPLLTWESPYALGDKRRPADTVMLSPLFTRLGLELTVDDESETALAEIPLPGGEVLPLHGFGRFVIAGKGAEAGDGCQIAAQGVLAQCRVGKGRALLIADAALLEPANAAHADAAEHLLEMAFE